MKSVNHVVDRCLVAKKEDYDKKYNILNPSDEGFKKIVLPVPGH